MAVIPGTWLLGCHRKYTSIKGKSPTNKIYNAHSLRSHYVQYVQMPIGIKSQRKESRLNAFLAGFNPIRCLECALRPYQRVKAFIESTIGPTQNIHSQKWAIVMDIVCIKRCQRQHCRRWLDPWLIGNTNM